MSDLNRLIAERLGCDPEDKDVWHNTSEHSYTSEDGLWQTDFGSPNQPAEFGKDGNAMLALIAAMRKAGWWYCLENAFEKGSGFYCATFFKRPADFAVEGVVYDFESYNRCPKKATQQAAAKALRLEVDDE